jgi:hypothetical protein
LARRSEAVHGIFELMKVSTIAPSATIVVMTFAFCAHAARIEDPALFRGSFPAGDARCHRYGSMTLAQVETLIAELRAQRDGAADSRDKALVSVRLADVYAARQLFEQSGREIDEARREAPDQPSLLIRAALIRHALGDQAGARALLDEAARRGAGPDEISPARSMVEGADVTGAPATGRYE